MKQKCLILISVLLIWSCSQPASWYYERAKVASENGDAPQALAYLRKAADMQVPDSLKSAIYSDMGHLLFEEGLQEQAMAAFVNAYDTDMRLADTTAIINDLCDIANVWRTREDDDSCLYFFDRAMKLAMSQGDSMAVDVIRSQMAGYHLWHHHYEDGRTLLAPALADPSLCDDPGIVFMAADLYHHTGNKDSARYFCQKLLDSEDTSHKQMAHKWLAEISLEEGKVDSAMAHLQAFEMLTDSLMEEIDTEALRRVNAHYDYTQREEENARLRLHYAIAITGVVVLAFFLALLAFHYRLRKMHYQLKIQQLEQLLANSRSRGEENAERSRQILANSPICQHINRLLSDTQQRTMTDEDWHILEDTIEKTHPGFKQRLNEFHKLSTQEMRISMLIKLRVNPIGIARLTSHSKQSVSSTRSRLFLKVFGQKGSPAQWDEFIQSL